MDLLTDRRSIAQAQSTVRPAVADLSVWAPFAARAAAATLLGASWSHGPHLAPFAALVVPLWWRARCRTGAVAVGALYQLGATHSLTPAAARFLDVSRVAAALALAAAAFVVGLGWGLTWPADAPERPINRLALNWFVWLVITISPVGLGSVMVAHPIVVAGFWFPHAGWWGLGLTGFVLLASARSWGLCVVLLLSCCSALRGGVSLPRPADIEAIQTRSSPALGIYDFASQYEVAQAALRAARAASSASIVVLAEGAAGAWTPAMRTLWEPYARELAAERRVALVGASLERPDGKLDNVALVIGHGGERLVPQRLPIPLAMWRPWSNTGFAAHPWDSGTLSVGDRTLGVLICWEGALVLPSLLSMAAGADLLVVMANHAWVGSAGAPMLLGPRAWGALFDVPVIVARNAQGGDDA